jgi:hypothetical protein
MPTTSFRYRPTILPSAPHHYARRLPPPQRASNDNRLKAPLTPSIQVGPVPRFTPRADTAPDRISSHPRSTPRARRRTFHTTGAGRTRHTLRFRTRASPRQPPGNAPQHPRHTTPPATSTPPARLPPARSPPPTRDAHSLCATTPRTPPHRPDLDPRTQATNPTLQPRPPTSDHAHRSAPRDLPATASVVGLTTTARPRRRRSR